MGQSQYRICVFTIWTRYNINYNRPQFLLHMGGGIDCWKIWLSIPYFQHLIHSMFFLVSFPSCNFFWGECRVYIVPFYAFRVQCSWITGVCWLPSFMQSHRPNIHIRIIKVDQSHLSHPLGPHKIQIEYLINSFWSLHLVSTWFLLVANFYVVSGFL